MDKNIVATNKLRDFLNLFSKNNKYNTTNISSGIPKIIRSL